MARIHGAPRTHRKHLHPQTSTAHMSAQSPASHSRPAAIGPQPFAEHRLPAFAEPIFGALDTSVETLNLEEAAKLLKVHPKTLQRLAQARRIPACKIGRAWIFVERLLVQHLVSESLLRVSVVDLQEKSECRSTDARTRHFGGSSYRRSGVNRSPYSKALGLPTGVKRSRSATSSQSPVGNKTDLA